jgi:hypothetical protein
VEHLMRGADQLVDRLDHMHGAADRARLVGDRAGYRMESVVLEGEARIPRGGYFIRQSRGRAIIEQPEE